MISLSTYRPTPNDQKLYHEYKLLEACVRSVVYHFKKDLDKLYAETEKSRDYFEKAGFYFSDYTERVKRAENQFWHSVTYMKWLRGDRVNTCWIRVKEGEDPCPEYRWIRIDHPPSGAEDANVGDGRVCEAQFGS